MRATGGQMPPYFVGLDLGQSQDYTALAIARRSAGTEDERRYDVVHLQRFALGTSYPAIVASVAGLLRRPPLPGDDLTLAVDATGVGPPVVDMLERANLPGRLQAITITGGDQWTHEGWRYRVPKRDLVSSVQVLLQGSRLKIAPALPEATTLVQELQNFQVKITAAANETYGAWREGTHDDLVLAVALACWSGEHEPRRWGAL